MIYPQPADTGRCYPHRARRVVPLISAAPGTLADSRRRSFTSGGGRPADDQGPARDALRCSLLEPILRTSMYPYWGLRFFGWGAAVEDQDKTGGGETVLRLPGREPVLIEVDAETADPATRTVTVQGPVAVLEGRHQVSARLYNSGELGERACPVRPAQGRSTKTSTPPPPARRPRTAARAGRPQEPSCRRGASVAGRGHGLVRSSAYGSPARCSSARRAGWPM